MKIGSILFDEFFSHPNKLYSEHINNMFTLDDTILEKEVKRFHDIAKLKNNFQTYIRGDKGIDKNHSLLSAYLFLLNSDFENRDFLFGFLAIASHHGNVENFYQLGEAKYLDEQFVNSKELIFLDEVLEHSTKIDIYDNLKGDIETLRSMAKMLKVHLLTFEFMEKFDYIDFIDFKKLYASLIYADKFEAIFGIKKETRKPIPKEILSNHIDAFPYHEKRDNFRQYVLNNFDASQKLFTLTAPTGYGKTLTALEFALKFKQEKIIFALPFTSIIDQTEKVVSDIFKKSDIDIFKVHHKTDIDESVPKDRYSQVKFLMSSFSGDINITTLYQIIFALFGNKNRDNVKFNQFRDAVVIIDEAQAIPYVFRQDFIELCRLISEQMNTVFIFMSATMPIMNDSFKEISNLDYFQEQNRYVLKWLSLENGQDSLMERVRDEAQTKHTLCVVNTVKKAQELYLKFRDEFECYCLNGYMTDHDKQRVVREVGKRLEQHEDKILLISTQSIEAGIDLDFEVGFREVAPISSIIQTAGRVNRHFGEHQGTLYIFDDICEYSDLIYGDLQQISQAIFEVLQNGDVEESNILEISRLYFDKIHKQLESFYIEKEIEKLEFFDINTKIEALMDGGDFKQLIIVEPYDGFIREIQDELYRIRREEQDKFRQKDLVQSQVKKMLQYGVNVNTKEIEQFMTPIDKVKSLHEMIYLPAGAMEYNERYGVKKYQLELEDSDMGFDF
jgi:CRISPR-associated endonuclease/helicase Cas3